MMRWMMAVTVAGAAVLAACGGEGGGVDVTAPANCKSGNAWSGGEGEDMAPGQACNACHSKGEGPTFQIAGTVMGAVDDDNNCGGVTGATIEITDANGTVHTFTSGANGNFSSRSKDGAIAMPYTAKVTVGGKSNSMVSPQSDGDCNTCHAAKGINGAPGRIYVP
jgi:cytochrome c5